MSKCIDTKGVHKVCEKGKICNPKTGRCIIDRTQPRTKKNIRDFVKDIRNYKTAKDVIEGYKDDNDTNKVIEKLKNYTVDDNVIEKNKNTKSIQGFIYERLWDICIKLGITDLTDINTKHGIGNINNKKDATFKNIKKYFDAYIKEGVISGNSGGYSDITFENENENKRILYLVSVKYIEGKNIKDFDIQNLCTIIKDREEEYIKQNKDDTDMKKYDIKTLLFVKNKKEFINLCEGANKSSNVLINYISPEGNYENVYDLGDLELHFYKLKKLLELFDYWKDTESIEIFKRTYLKIKDRVLRPFIPRFHQELFVEKITALMKTIIHTKNKNILVGAIPRSGKTYMMAGAILRHVKEHMKTERTYNNYVIITPAPNETLIQYKETFDNHIDFKRYNIEAGIVKAGKDKDIEFNENKGKHYVYLISKQRLGNVKGDNVEIDDNIYKDNIERYFGKKNNIKIIFMDEAHFGMTTEIAQQIVKTLNTNDSVKIFVTATYNKPQKEYGIASNYLIKWDLDDIKMIKDMTNKTSSFREVVKHLSKRFSKNIVKKVLKNNGWDWGDQSTVSINNNNKTIIENIIKQYMYFPEPYMITSVWDSEFFEQQRKLLVDTNVGFNMGKLFQHKTNVSFVNEEQLVQLFQYYFGYPATDDDNRISMGYATQNQYKMKGVLPRIERICNNKCRTLQTPLHKTTQLWFLPPDHIAHIMNALLHLLNFKFHYIFTKYMFYIADRAPTFGNNRFANVEYMEKADNIKKEIRNLEEKIRDSKYDGLIILAGKRLQLGISLENVDIVSLFTNITATDAIYQMIFRSMTEIDDDVKCDGSSFCPKKKYGFMVDLNPQRTIYTLEYFADRISNKDDKEGGKEEGNRIIADLINIDKDKFINKYETETDNQRYVKEFFDRLTSSWEINTENIKTILKEQDIFTENIKDLLTDDFDIRRLFNNEKGKNKKAVIIPEQVFLSGKRRLKDIYTKQPKIKNEISVSEMWYDILSESISILTFISSYSNLECIFTDDKIKEINYEILKIFDELDNDEHLKEIFVFYLKKRVIKKDTISNYELFNMVYNIIRLMNEKPAKLDRQSGGHIEINKIIHMKKQKIYNIKELDKLLEFINANLAPKQTEKKERGEVFTPMKLVNEMLDTLPKDVWRNKDLKWLDPAAGMGNFPVAVYMRLMDGLNSVIQNEEERRKHILENMLYMVEFDKANVFMMKKIFCGKNRDGKGTYQLNIFEGSFIEDDDYIRGGIDIYYSTNTKPSQVRQSQGTNFNIKANKDVIDKIRKFDNQFDIILGNPPFNKGGVGKGGGVFWKYFVDKSFKLLKKDGYILMIHPTGWRKPVSLRASAGDIWNLFKKYNLLFLKITDEQIPHFPKVDYYLLKKSTIQQDTKVVNQFGKPPSIGVSSTSSLNLYNLPFIPHLINNEVISIMNKLLKKKGDKFDIKRNQTIKPKKGILNNSGIPHARYYDINTKKYQEVLEKYLNKPDYILTPKIIMTYSGGKTPANLYAKYFSKEIGVTDNTMYQIITKKDNINNLITFLNSRLIHFILKITQYSSAPNYKNEFNILNMFAKPNEGTITTDEDVYNYYKLTKNERSLINKIIGDYKVLLHLSYKKQKIKQRKRNTI